MLCALYKPTIRNRRWYVYIWLHSVTIAVVNAWLLYRRHQQQLYGATKTKPLRQFQLAVACSAVSAGKRVRGRPSLGSPTANLPPKWKRKVQKKTNDDIRKDGIDHLPLWEEKRQRCAMCPGPAAFSYVKCQKCQVWFCLNKDRNCFRKFHA